MKFDGEIMEILAVYDLTGSLRATAELTACSHHTVARHVAARDAGRSIAEPAYAGGSRTSSCPRSRNGSRRPGAGSGPTRPTTTFLRSASGIVSASNVSAVLLIDLDGFKQIDDTYGHDAGDGALVAFAGILWQHAVSRRHRRMPRRGRARGRPRLPRLGLLARADPYDLLEPALMVGVQLPPSGSSRG
jgi:hypothetical protein